MINTTWQSINSITPPSEYSELQSDFCAALAVYAQGYTTLATCAANHDSVGMTAALQSLQNDSTLLTGYLKIYSTDMEQAGAASLGQLQATIPTIPPITNTTVPTPQPPQSLPIVDSTVATPNYISIPAETNKNYTFNIAQNMTNVSVTGYFECTESSPNLIEVYIMDDATYAKWLKNPSGQSTILYDSEEMSSGSVSETNLTPGTYHLVFSNKSSDAAQDVIAKIDLYWTYSQ